jgi:Peroxin-3
MFTVLGLYPNMAQQILEEVRVEGVLAELQMKRVTGSAVTGSVKAVSNSEEGEEGRASMVTTNTNWGEESDRPVLVSQKKSKTELWNQLKIMSSPSTPWT